jgi:L-malate glycosyltransferase
LNICIVSSWVPSKRRPHFAPFVYNFAENLGRFGHTVSLVCPREHGEISISHEDMMTIYRVNGRFPIYSILAAVSRIKPQIIHVHAPNFFSCSAIVAARLKKIPIIATVHRAEVDSVSNPTYFFRKHALARFARIISVSNHTRSLAINAGVQHSKISVIYNSCDEKSFFFRNDKESLRKKHNFQTHDKLILFVGNLIRRKGVALLIESLKLLQQNVPNFLVTIVGQGEELHNLKELVDKYALTDRVKFYGRVTKKELSDLSAIADVFVLPSSSEGHSVALLEAMASGLPIVASNIEGNRESVEDGINGLLFKNGNREDLAEKLTTILTDQKLRQSLSLNSSETYLKKFSTKAQIDNYLRIYSSLINYTDNFKP